MPKASGKFWISFFVWIFLIGFLSLTPKTGIPLESLPVVEITPGPS